MIWILSRIRFKIESIIKSMIKIFELISISNLGMVTLTMLQNIKNLLNKCSLIIFIHFILFYLQIILLCSVFLLLNWICLKWLVQITSSLCCLIDCLIHYFMFILVCWFCWLYFHSVWTHLFIFLFIILFKVYYIVYSFTCF
jgi:hypothetical protein